MVEHTIDTSLPDKVGVQRLIHIAIPNDRDEVTVHQLTEYGIDFSQFHPDYEGRDTPYLFGSTRQDTRYGDPFDSLICIDLRDHDKPQQLWTIPEHVFVGEPPFPLIKEGHLRLEKGLLTSEQIDKRSAAGNAEGINWR